jgi:hypothetical protein
MLFNQGTVAQMLNKPIFNSLDRHMAGEISKLETMLEKVVSRREGLEVRLAALLAAGKLLDERVEASTALVTKGMKSVEELLQALNSRVEFLEQLEVNLI